MSVTGQSGEQILLSAYPGAVARDTEVIVTPLASTANLPAGVEFISGVMTLWPGDVIATGTTSGIGPMQSGDSVEVRIEGIGSLINRVDGAEQ